MADFCPTSPTGKHSLGGTFATVTYKAEFEPVQYGEAAEDTLYKRTEFIISTCGCGHSVKKRLKVDHE